MSTDQDEFLTMDEVASICKVSPGTIANWIAGRRPNFPKGFKLGDGKSAPRRWRKSVIIQYIQSHEQNVA